MKILCKSRKVLSICFSSMCFCQRVQTDTCLEVKNPKCKSAQLSSTGSTCSPVEPASPAVFAQPSKHPLLPTTPHPSQGTLGRSQGMLGYAVSPPSAPCVWGEEGVEGGCGFPPLGETAQRPSGVSRRKRAAVIYTADSDAHLRTAQERPEQACAARGWFLFD